MTNISSEAGFTLIELLVTLTIVSILAATAIPAYKDYRARSYDYRALSDVRAVALGEETYYLDNEQYLSCANAQCNTLPGISVISEGTEIQVTAAEDSFQINGSHPKGSGKQYRWDSSQGGLVG